MTYSVTVSFNDGRALIEHIDAQTPHLACNAVEKMHEGGRVVAISSTMLVMGRCGVCGGIILDTGDQRQRRGRFRCVDCI